MSLTRIILGVMFVFGGMVKTEILGKQLVPDVYNSFSDMFEKVFELFPENDCTAAKFQNMIGYLEMIGGFLLLSGYLMGPACFVLIMIMLGASYSLFKVGHPSMLVKLSPLVLCYPLRTIGCPMLSQKMKREKSD